MAERKPIAVLGAPSNLGLKPYDDGKPRGVDRAPRVYRDLGLVERLGARDLGDIQAPPYRDFERPDGGIRNEPEIDAYSQALGRRVAEGTAEGDFLLVLGGDCSILLGTLSGLRQGGPCGLAFVDGHCDFALPSISTTGGAAGMDLALAVGRNGRAPLVREEDVVVLGRKDEADEPYYGVHSLPRSAVQDLPYEQIRTRGVEAVTGDALQRLARTDLRGFWMHLDVDVLDPAVMPAVDSPEPGGLGIDDLAALLLPLARHPRALGLQVTVYDPNLDPDGACASRLVALLERVLVRS